MRTITDHQVNPANDKLNISVVDKPGAGGANHHYYIDGFDTGTNPSASFHTNHLILLFQNGPINEVGVNGVTHEALLAVVVDRLRSFQSGPYACRENALALTKLEEGLMWLLQRTRGRMARGVEGTHTK